MMHRTIERGWKGEFSGVRPDRVWGGGSGNDRSEVAIGFTMSSELSDRPEASFSYTGSQCNREGIMREWNGGRSNLSHYIELEYLHPTHVQQFKCPCCA